jgi:putative transcriptional regulator
MIKYKINVADALERTGFNTYKAKQSKILSQDTLKKIKSEDTNISLQSLNNLCIVLDMDLKDVVTFEMTEEDKLRRENIFKK